ncbi:PstS family phosphate ABC transporter substrate-binding protein [Larkinella terrae]|uniref:Phosphate ABC transporter substrate-binding protein n=1 Tax=Larkinella terrae TaxID=2025311 RepID=A0A7K0EGI0_9BACT|nr:substrate-binding domain-containing protein [Larkinella terrae]MRS60548.1 phosphate ABC transporter substrate-binding protein [Larkinella terrae]
MNNLIKIGIGIGLISLAACSSSPPPDNPTHGKINITADESLEPMVESIYKAYEGVYPNAKFNVVYKPEQEAITTMLRDSARLVFSTRELNDNEKSVFAKNKIKYKSEFIATDGIALIVGRENPDSLITMAELNDIFQGRIKNWEQLKRGSQKGPIVLVFDNNNSSNLNFALKQFKVSDLSRIKIFTVKSNKQVIEYVRKNPTALGFIGVNWISDGDSPLAAELSKNLRVMGVSEDASPDSIDDFFQPFQKNLGLKIYPLRRNVYVISREAHSGLGSGLINYIIRDVGGLLIEKSGLWPTKPYNREVFLEKKLN